jgi:hypothetical protein
MARANQHTGGKWNVYDEQIKELLEENQGISTVDVANKINQDLIGSDRKEFLRYIRRNMSRIADVNEGIYEACEDIKVDFTSAKNLWIKTKNKDGGGVSGFIVNPNYVTPVEEDKIIKEIDFLSIFKERVSPVIIENRGDYCSETVFDRLVYTDVHIGMEVNPDGYSLYGGVWNEVEIFNRLRIMIAHTIKFKRSNVLHIDELGDFVDGWDGETTRKGHKLPQNMDNQGMYDVGVRFKIELIDSLIAHFDKIICHNICEDNHAGSFGYIINSAFKTYIELKYPGKVEVINQRKFIDHYFATPVHCFPLTHGKDSKSLKFGFKPILDKAQENKIDNYIKEYFILQKGVKIEFCKGDSHQYITDNSTSKSFSYNNFPAFSPPSGWVQVNFQNSISGFVHYNYYDNGQKSINDHIFK